MLYIEVYIQVHSSKRHVPANNGHQETGQPQPYASRTATYPPPAARTHRFNRAAASAASPAGCCRPYRRSHRPPADQRATLIGLGDECCFCKLLACKCPQAGSLRFQLLLLLGSGGFLQEADVLLPLGEMKYILQATQGGAVQAIQVCRGNVNM